MRPRLPTRRLAPLGPSSCFSPWEPTRVSTASQQRRAYMGLGGGRGAPPSPDVFLFVIAAMFLAACSLFLPPCRCSSESGTGLGGMRWHGGAMTEGRGGGGAPTRMQRLEGDGGGRAEKRLRGDTRVVSPVRWGPPPVVLRFEGKTHFCSGCSHSSCDRSEGSASNKTRKRFCVSPPTSPDVVFLKKHKAGDIFRPFKVYNSGSGIPV